MPVNGNVMDLYADAAARSFSKSPAVNALAGQSGSHRDAMTNSHQDAAKDRSGRSASTGS